jgi:hypothetical protein
VPEGGELPPEEELAALEAAEAEAAVAAVAEAEVEHAEAEHAIAEVLEAEGAEDVVDELSGDGTADEQSAASETSEDE